METKRKKLIPTKIEQEDIGTIEVKETKQGYPVEWAGKKIIKKRH